MMLFDFLARRDATREHFKAIATNGSITGARSSKSTKNGSTGDTDPIMLGAPVQASPQLLPKCSVIRKTLPRLTHNM
ncbi:hypothetical protein RB195_008856 [Necator americanus]|uniref:Uncharacterized protein n=1 Tax=Necator americanus TaxID=51031 RepID=A0ABR1CSC9_NECAM